jgi:hypothetical protein
VESYQTNEKGEGFNRGALPVRYVREVTVKFLVIVEFIFLDISQYMHVFHVVYTDFLFSIQEKYRLPLKLTVFQFQLISFNFQSLPIQQFHPAHKVSISQYQTKLLS